MTEVFWSPRCKGASKVLQGIWGFSKIMGTFLGVPIIISILGSILGPPYLGNCHLTSTVLATSACRNLFVSVSPFLVPISPDTIQGLGAEEFRNGNLSLTSFAHGICSIVNAPFPKKFSDRLKVTSGMNQHHVVPLWASYNLGGVCKANDPKWTIYHMNYEPSSPLKP